MENKDVRWEQRFANYGKALSRLGEAVELSRQQELSDLEKEGLVQRFEYTYELAWKTLQDLLRSKGYLTISGPNPVLSQALIDGYIADASGWRAMKKSRELLAHTYNEETANEIIPGITSTYWSLLSQLAVRLDEERRGPKLDFFDK